MGFHKLVLYPVYRKQPIPISFIYDNGVRNNQRDPLGIAFSGVHAFLTNLAITLYLNTIIIYISVLPVICS